MASQRFFLAFWALEALAGRQELRYSEEVEPEETCDLPKLNGFEKHCGFKCKSRSLSQLFKGSPELAEKSELCGKACGADQNCNCFTMTSDGGCRIGITTDSSKIKTTANSAAYVRGSGGQGCARGEVVAVEGDCFSYHQCVASNWTVAACPDGMAFSAQRSQCEWSAIVPGCAESDGSDRVTEVHCGSNRTFFLAHGQHMQSWLRQEVSNWQMEAGKKPEQRAKVEGKAAASILNSVGIEFTTSTESAPKRWAVFSRGADGGLELQAVALVNQQGNFLDIMAIVSRRSLLNDKASVSGAGRSLLGAILETIHAEVPAKPLIVQGTPGDKVVETMYREHGMKEVGRSKETGKPLLQMRIAPTCVGFFKATLCRELTLKSKAAIAWSLVPGSRHFHETCAHMIPAELYWEQIKKG